MAIKIAHASIDENGRIAGGKAGDQTSKEVCIRTWYNNQWNVMIRAKNDKVAEKIAANAEKAAKNDEIGYNQNDRLSLYTEACKVNHDISKIKTACNTDCSALVSEAVIAAGIKVSPANTTRSLKASLASTGEFVVHTESKYLTTDANLKRGDILLKEGSHVVVVIENGENNTNYTKEKFISDVLEIVGVKTVEEALKKVPTISKKSNAKHALVTPLERYFKSLGYYTGSIEADLGKTPTFGAGCATAVQKYQKEVLGYKTVDDEITAGGKMWKSLLTI